MTELTPNQIRILLRMAVDDFLHQYSTGGWFWHGYGRYVATATPFPSDLAKLEQAGLIERSTATSSDGCNEHLVITQKGRDWTDRRVKEPKREQQMRM